MSEQAKHSPLPWVSSDGYLMKAGGFVPVRPVYKEYVTNRGGDFYSEAQANAAFIVRAVNAHDALVEALKWFADRENWREEQLSEGFVYSAEWRVGFSPIEIARAALALAEGKP